MNAFDIIVITLISAAVLAVIGVNIYKKIKGKGGCSCGCEECGMCSSCRGCKHKKSQ